LFEAVSDETCTSVPSERYHLSNLDICYDVDSLVIDLRFV